MPFVDVKAEQESLMERRTSRAPDAIVGKDRARKRLLAVSILSDMEKSGRTLAVVTRPYAYSHPLLAEPLEIPIGFVTDFASIPPGFWWVVQPFGRHAPAAVIHDYLYALREPGTRKMADYLFCEAMRESGVPYWRRNLMYWTVRLGGFRAFKNNKDFVFVDPEYGLPTNPPDDIVKTASWRTWKEYRKLKRNRQETEMG